MNPCQQIKMLITGFSYKKEPRKTIKGKCWKGVGCMKIGRAEGEGGFVCVCGPSAVLLSVPEIWHIQLDSNF
jgi:hypothetical protein